MSLFFDDNKFPWTQKIKSPSSSQFFVVYFFKQWYFPTQYSLSIQVATGEILIEFVIIIFGFIFMRASLVS